jgi:hypothetical protein
VRPPPGAVRVGSDSFHGEAMALRGLPVDTGKANPLRSRARSGAQQLVQLLEAGGRVGGIGNAEVVVVGLVIVLAELRAEQLDLRVVGGGQIKELGGIFYRGHAGIVAVIAVEGGKPEELVAADATAQSEAPHGFVVRRGERNRREGGGSGGSGVLNPLRKGIARAPGVLAVEEECLAVELVCAALGFEVDAAACAARALGLNVAGNGLHLADA